jgi:preprotein translocase subunit Sss1
MNQLVVGKALEVFGAISLSYVGVRAAIIELFIVAPLRSGNHAPSSSMTSAAHRLEKAQEARRREFGPYEALIVAVGAVFVAVGCIWYLVALMMEK